MQINGYTVITSALIPAWRWTGPVVLRDACPVSDGFRAEFNDWAISIFGGDKTTNVWLNDDQRAIYAHPSVVAELTKQLSRR